MNRKKRLEQIKSERQQHWNYLSRLIEDLRKELALETRREEKSRLRHRIEGREAERNQVEQELDDVEKTLSEIEDLQDTLALETSTPTISSGIHEKSQRAEPPYPSTPTSQPLSANPPDASERIASVTTFSTSPELSLLKEALERHSLVLFIGPDLPAAVTGLSSRADLARDLARRKELDETLPLAEVAQRVSQAGNRWEFTDFIRNALDTTGKSPQPFHRQVAALVKDHQIETIITIAYDNLLDLAFQQAGLGVNRVVHSSNVNFINPDWPTLIKLYGDAQQPDTLVVTDQDHSNLLRDRDREAILDEVRRAFRRNTMLFLGYNLADPDFRFLFDQVAESRFARTAYAVWPSLPEVDVRMWRDRGIVILEADPLGVVDQITHTSRNELSRRSEKEILLQSVRPESLEDILIIRREKNGRPYNAGPGQWFIRLEVGSKKAIKNCQGWIRNTQRLDSPEKDISYFQFSILSWADNKFEPIPIRPHKPEYLDLVWRATGDSPFPQDELRVASAREQGKRDVKFWGMRQDFIPLKSGYYLLVVQIMAEGYAEPVKRTYRLHWPGPGQEDDIRLTVEPVVQPESAISIQSSEEPITLSAPDPSQESRRERRKRSRLIVDHHPNVTLSLDFQLERTEGPNDWAGVRLRGQQTSREGYFIIVRRNGRIEIVLIDAAHQEHILHSYHLPPTFQPLHFTITLRDQKLSIKLGGTEVLRSEADQYQDVGGVFLEVCRATATFSNLRVEPISSELSKPSTEELPP